MPRKHSLLKLGYEYTRADNPLYLCILKKKKLLKCCISLDRESTVPSPPLFLRWNIISFYMFSKELFLIFLVIFFYIFYSRGPKPLWSNAWRYEVELYVIIYDVFVIYVIIYVIIIELGYTINVMCLNYSKTNHPNGPWKNCLQWNGFLVPENLV